MISDGEDEQQSFQTQEEEVRYWKNKAAIYRKRLQESHQELEEYQSHSGELEAELEAELEQSQARCTELRHQVAKLATENEIMKDRLASQSVALEGRVDSLEEELQDVRSIKEGLTAYIRQLEQANDDLERAKRATLTSLEDFEARLNQAIERNAFLESELDEKESLKEMVQRLKDESRDLRQEVCVRQQQPRPPDSPGLALDNDRAAAVLHHQRNGKLQSNGLKSVSSPPSSPTAGLPHLLAPNQYIIDSNKLACEVECTNGTDGSDELRAHPPGDTLAPSTRITALNIVGDLLRKVGALESRLASCRTLVKENQRVMPMTPPAGNHSAR